MREWYEYEATMHFFKQFFDAANQNAEAVNRQLIRITQRNLNAGLDLAKSLASARHPSEIVKLQASFWWKQFDEFNAQVEEVRRRLFGAAIDRELMPEPEFAPQPEGAREPRLMEPATKLPTRPKQDRRPATHDPANPSPRQKPARQQVEMPMVASQGSRAAQSEAGPPKPRLPRSKAEKRSTRPRSLSRDPARKPRERKPQATRTPPRRSARADAARPNERQSGTQKGAPHKTAPQALPIGVKFGMLDGNAVRFTDFEAWWLLDGAWRPISPGKVLSNAAVMREARFKEVFPQVPILPRKAFQPAAEEAKKKAPDS